MARMNVSLEDSLVEELRRVVPRRRRSRFIAKAVQEKLDQIKQQRAVHAAAGIWKRDSRSEVEKEIRALRSAWKGRTGRFEESGG